MDLSFVIALYMTVSIAVIFALWFFIEQRSTRFFRGERIRSVYHCLKCGTLYSSRGDKPSDCPACKFENQKLRY